MKQALILVFLMSALISVGWAAESTGLRKAEITPELRVKLRQIMSKSAPKAGKDTAFKVIMPQIVTGVKGFTAWIPKERTSFNLGVTLADIEVALTLEDKKMTAQLLGVLDDGLTKNDMPVELRTYVKEKNKEILGSSNLKEALSTVYPQIKKQIEAKMKEDGVESIYEFGRWVELTKISINVFDDISDVKNLSGYYVMKLKSMDIKEGVFASLQTFDNVIKSDMENEIKKRKMLKELVNILDLLR